MKYSSWFKLIQRIMATPFLYGCLLISYNFSALKRMVLFVRYGGEFIIYEKQDFKAIQDIFNEIKSEKGPSNV